MDFLASSHEVAESLRTHIIFKILPVMNPDGVFMGNTRCNLVSVRSSINDVPKVAKTLVWVTEFCFTLFVGRCLSNVKNLTWRNRGQKIDTIQ